MVGAAHVGDSALRMARVMSPAARLYSIELSEANARIARRIWDHAGIGDRATVVVGFLGDGGQTMARPEAEYRFESGSVDFVFLDHDKAAYLPDLEPILCRGGCMAPPPFSPGLRGLSRHAAPDAARLLRPRDDAVGIPSLHQRLVVHPIGPETGAPLSRGRRREGGAELLDRASVRVHRIAGRRVRTAVGAVGPAVPVSVDSRAREIYLALGEIRLRLREVPDLVLQVVDLPVRARSHLQSDARDSRWSLNSEEPVLGDLAGYHTVPHGDGADGPEAGARRTEGFEHEAIDAEAG